MPGSQPRRICRVVSVQNSVAARVHAPWHGLGAGARVNLTGISGMPDLEGRVFIVGTFDRDNFDLMTVQEIAVQSLDIISGILKTAAPHGQHQYDSVRLINLDVSDDLAKKLQRLPVERIIDQTTIQLAGKYCPVLRVVKQWDPLAWGLEELAVGDGLLRSGLVVGRTTPIDLSAHAFAGKNGSIMPVPSSNGLDELEQWSASLRIADVSKRFLKGRKPVLNTQIDWFAKITSPSVVPEALQVDFCGMVDHSGIYNPVDSDSTDVSLALEQVHVRGSSCIAFSRTIGAWCFLSDVWPGDYRLYKLSHGREAAGLIGQHGARQLLYFCLDKCPTGRWVAVLGEEPAPQVAKLPPVPPSALTLIRKKGFPLERYPCLPALATLKPEVRFQIFGPLLDFDGADHWRGFVDEGAVHGFSAAALGERLLELTLDARRIRCVCRGFKLASDAYAKRWPAALQTLLQVRIGEEASVLRQVEESTFYADGTFPLGRVPRAALQPVVPLLSLDEIICLNQASRHFHGLVGGVYLSSLAAKPAWMKMKRIIRLFSHTRHSWALPFSILDNVAFKAQTWAASISELKAAIIVSGNINNIFDKGETLALQEVLPGLIVFARELLRDTPVCWDREATVNSFCNISPMETEISSSLVSIPKELKAKAQLYFADGELLSRSGEALRGRLKSAMRKLSIFVSSLSGASVQGPNWKMYFSAPTRNPGQQPCSRMLSGMGCPGCPSCRENRGWSELRASLDFNFQFANIPVSKHAGANQHLLTVKLNLQAFVTPFLCTSADTNISMPFDAPEGESTEEWDDDAEEDDDEENDEGSVDDAVEAE